MSDMPRAKRVAPRKDGAKTHFRLSKKRFLQFYATKSAIFSISVAFFLLCSAKFKFIDKFECYQKTNLSSLVALFQRTILIFIKFQLIYTKKYATKSKKSIHLVALFRIFRPFSERKCSEKVSFTVSGKFHGESSRLYAPANRRNGPRQTCSPCSPLCEKASTTSYPTCLCRQQLPLATAK